MTAELPVIWQDEHLVAINKPSGLLVHRSYLARHETQFAMQILRDQLGQHVFPLHRLDRPTSGVLLFALNSEMAKRMQDVFSGRQVRKEYHAVARGYVPETGVIDYPLKEELDKIADAQANQDKDAQDAITAYECLKKVELPYKVSKKHDTTRYSLVKLYPETGRKHQIRRHLAHIRHPIVGDTNHGDGRHNRFFREHFNSNRLLLAATRLTFNHPVTGMEIDITLPIPEQFLRPFTS